MLVAEVLEWLLPALADGAPLVDCTVGGGGHVEAFVRHLPDLEVVGLDRDDEALEAARERLAPVDGRVLLVKANFRDLDEVIAALGFDRVGAVLYDLGVSSAQLDRPERGFSYRADAGLDMRMDTTTTKTAADVVNEYSLQELTRILAEYGEEKYARRVAKAIVHRRAKRPFSGTVDLAEVVKSAIPAPARRMGPHPARRAFQALRIEVNEELESLRESLEHAVNLLRPAGRIAVISYHSLEDRIVKRFFQRQADPCVCPPDLPVCVCGRKPVLEVLTRRPVRPGQRESERNPRADSARLRVARRLEEAA